MKILIVILITLALNSIALATDTNLICGKIKYITNKHVHGVNKTLIVLEDGTQTEAEIVSSTVINNGAANTQNLITIAQKAKSLGKIFCRYYSHYSIGLERDEYLATIRNFDEKVNDDELVCGKVKYIVNVFRGSRDITRIFFYEEDNQYTDIPLYPAVSSQGVFGKQNMLNAVLEAMSSGEIFCRHYSNYSVGLEKEEFLAATYHAE